MLINQKGESKWGLTETLVSKKKGARIVYFTRESV